MDPTAIMSMMGGGGSGKSMGGILDMALSWATTGGQNQLIKAQNAHAAAITEINNKLRAEQNDTSAAWAATRQTFQAMNNNTTLRTGGEAVTTQVTNTLRQRDQLDLSNLSRRISEMEARGAAAAAQSASGLGGSVGEMVSQTISLRQSMDAETIRRNRRGANSDAGIRVGDIMRQAVSSLNAEVLDAQLDFRQDVAQQQGTLSPFTRIMKAGGFEKMGTVADGARSMWTAAKSYRSGVSVNDPRPDPWKTPPKIDFGGLTFGGVGEESPMPSSFSG